MNSKDHKAFEITEVNELVQQDQCSSTINISWQDYFPYQFLNEQILCFKNNLIFCLPN